MKSFMVSGTPWETHELKGVTVHVKREDLCCEPPGPPYSKMRGLELFLRKQVPGTPIGVQDAGFHSRSGWGTAFLCSRLKMPCYVVYSVYAHEGTLEDHPLREYQQNAKDLGAHLIPVKAGRATVAYHQGKRKMLELTNGKGIMLPAGLKVSESVEGTAQEVRDHTPDELRRGTWIISISSGTVASGVLAGLRPHQRDIVFICHFGSQKNEARTRAYMVGMIGYQPNALLYIDEGYGYSDALEIDCPFPASPWYERKAWKWLESHINNLAQPVVFWNIGT